MGRPAEALRVPPLHHAPPQRIRGQAKLVGVKPLLQGRLLTQQFGADAACRRSCVCGSGWRGCAEEACLGQRGALVGQPWQYFMA